MISNSQDRQEALPEIEGLLAGLDTKSAPVRQTYARTRRVDERLRSRAPEALDPTYVGLVHEGDPQRRDDLLGRSRQGV